MKRKGKIELSRNDGYICLDKSLDHRCIHLPNSFNVTHKKFFLFIVLLQKEKNAKKYSSLVNDIHAEIEKSVY